MCGKSRCPWALFHFVQQYIESLGPVKMEVMKTQVSYGAKTKFVRVWLLQLWIQKRVEKSIPLRFDLKRRIDDLRIEDVVEPRPGRFTHQVIIEKVSDLDDDVQEWLREAYELHR